MSYFPETIAYVHFKCHQKIHDPDHPLDVWIQYEPEDSKKFYESIIWNLAWIDRFDDKTAIKLVKQITKNFDK